MGSSRHICSRKDSFELGIPVCKLVGTLPCLNDEHEIGSCTETAVCVDLSCGKQR